MEEKLKTEAEIRLTQMKIDEKSRRDVKVGDIQRFICLPYMGNNV